jgi:hypothetical protein
MAVVIATLETPNMIVVFVKNFQGNTAPDNLLSALSQRTTIIFVLKLHMGHDKLSNFTCVLTLHFVDCV